MLQIFEQAFLHTEQAFLHTEQAFLHKNRLFLPFFPLPHTKREKTLHFSCISAFYFVSLQGQRLSNVGKR